MEKPRTRKPEIIQMKYPAPYSHSWASPNTGKKLQRSKKKARKNTSLLQENTCCYRSKPLFGAGSYAPHLKYGIFPQQAPNTRSQMETTKIKKSTHVSVKPRMAPAAPHIHDKDELKSDVRGPLFVIRSIDKQHRRQLNVSEMLHLDIKPQRPMPRSPIRKSSPLFKSAIPKMNAVY